MDYFRLHLQPLGLTPEITIPLKPTGSHFQQCVWNELRQIPYGTLTTYGAIAKKVGKVTLTA
jgi:methylated-DNA-[protein]-cysteine S-methyltransferase